jgi:antitoxin ParD1/3/4
LPVQGLRAITEQKMTTLNVSLPDDLEKFVEREAQASGYASPEAFVCALIEAMRRQKSIATLEKTLVDRINGPAAVELTPEVWSDLQSRVRQRLGAPN